MKRKILTLIFVITATFAFSQANFVTISGYVTNASTSSAIANHEVYIYADSSQFQPMFNYSSQVYTNANGFYIDTIPVTYQGGVYNQGGFYVSTYNCNGAYIYTNVSFSPNSLFMQANFTICDSIPPVGCNAYFYSYPDTSTTQHTYYFVDNSTGNPTSWFWDFGDGTSGTGQYPVHTYSSNGAYHVCLTISGDSCQSTYCNWVSDSTSPGGCSAYFYTYSDTTNGYLDSTIYFANASTGTNSNTSYYWDFGDGTNSSLQNPTHTYQTYGTYTVCLSIWDSLCQDTYCSTIVVGSNDSSACYAYYYWTTNNIDSVYFYDYSGTNAADQVISWTWSFGDGTSSTDQNPVHVYGIGQYYVCLAISTASGCSSTFCDYVNVYSNDSTNCNLYVNANSIIDESSTGAADGAINIDVYGGTPPYTFEWSNGATTQNITGLTQGYYDVIVKDNSGLQGCETWATFEILNQSDSTNWGTYDSLVTIPLDTCFNFPIGNAYIYSFSFINNNTIAITWIVYDPQGTNHSFVTVLYTFPANGNYQVPLTIICDSLKAAYNFYDQIHIMNQASDIVENYSSENITLYPNPVTDNVNLDLNSTMSGMATIRIIDEIGQVIMTKEIATEAGRKTITLNTSSLPKGLFFIQLINNGKIVTGRFIK